MARLDPVNKPELLPAEFTTVIDVAGFLTPREEAEIAKKIAALEKDTGFKLRVLAQNYPETPGLAIRYSTLFSLATFFRPTNPIAFLAYRVFYDSGQWEGHVHFTALLPSLVPPTREWPHWLQLALRPQGWVGQQPPAH